MNCRVLRCEFHVQIQTHAKKRSLFRLEWFCLTRMACPFRHRQFRGLHAGEFGAIRQSRRKANPITSSATSNRHCFVKITAAKIGNHPVWSEFLSGELGSLEERFDRIESRFLLTISVEQVALQMATFGFAVFDLPSAPSHHAGIAVVTQNVENS